MAHLDAPSPRRPDPQSGTLRVTRGAISRRLASTSLLLALLLAASGCGRPNSSEPRSQAAARTEACDRYLEVHHRNGDFSGVVIAAEGPEILYERAYGFADYETRSPIGLDSAIAIGSVSKIFTAAAIQDLADRGLVGLPTSVADILGGFPRSMTIEHLLTHRAGLPRFERRDGVRPSLDELVRSLQRKEPAHAPGAESVYSNEGYVVLARVVEVISSLSFSDYLATRFFEPLGMKRTGVQDGSSNDPRRDVVSGHRVGPQGPERVEPEDYSHMVGSGSAFSSARDLLRWLRAEPTGELERLDYPYGWGRRSEDGLTFFEQSGLIDGYSAHVFIDPRRDRYLIYLTNISSGLFNFAPKALRSLLFDETATELPAPPPTLAQEPLRPEALEDYVGSYRTSSDLLFRISHDDGALFIHWHETSPGVLLSPVEPDIFLNRSDFSSNTFERNAEGSVSGFTISLGGQRVHCRRVLERPR